jgi:hypothetical protein
VCPWRCTARQAPRRGMWRARASAGRGGPSPPTARLGVHLQQGRSLQPALRRARASPPRPPSRTSSPPPRPLPRAAGGPWRPRGGSRRGIGRRWRAARACCCENTHRVGVKSAETTRSRVFFFIGPGRGGECGSQEETWR